MSLGLDDAGCDVANKINCAVLTLNGVETKPFEVFIIDGQNVDLHS